MRATALCLLACLGVASSFACETCRPRVRAAVYGPRFGRDLATILAPLGGVALCAAMAWRRR